MIALLLKHYFTLLLSVGIASLILLSVGLYFIFRKPIPEQTIVEDDFEDEVDTTLSSESVLAIDGLDDFIAISGDDVVATQLDLARAYLETGKQDAAQEILHYVALQGNERQREEAQHLMKC